MNSSVQSLATSRPHIATKLPGPKAAAIIERDHRVLSPSYTRSYPFVIDRGEGAMVEDVDGNTFLDCTAGIAVTATGHSHPKVVEAIEKQASHFLHMSGTDFYYESMVQLAEKLAQVAPGDVSRCVYFGNSGTEATEAALKLARYSTGRQHLISFYGSFHGRTMGALSLTASKSIQKKGFSPMVPGVHHIPYPNCYRCPYDKTPDTCAVDCAKAIESQIITHITPADEIAAVFVEPIQGEGGYIVPPQQFFDELQSVTKKHDILLVCDEVQSGIGRTGKMWASEHFGVVPDIMTSAKGLASGLPLSAMITRSEIMTWKPGAHASTFGGNPVAIAASLATLKLVEDELMDNARAVGNYIFERTADWTRRFPIVGQVRGKGLMIGIEIVHDQATKERAPELRNQLEAMAFERGLLVLGAGANSIRLCPPLVLNRDQADFAVDTLEECLGILTSQN